MSDNKTYRIISIIALVLSAIGITLGYAAFSNTLTIVSSAEVNPSSAAFNVDFSSSSSSVETNSIAPTLNTTATGFSATSATINNATDPVISNLKATFTEPGQSATYTFYAYNAGEYIAYLNSIVFSGNKTCTAKTGTTQALVNTACNGISLSIKVGSESPTTTSIASISGHSLAKTASEEIVVVIEYAAGSGLADGDFDVTFPDIVLTYDSVD
ncbi:MAG: hypothetical protein IJI60_02350 [Bacilli bacterium]|nr:hypothetical protein [Bacilli bacterium]